MGPQPGACSCLGEESGVRDIDADSSASVASTRRRVWLDVGVGPLRLGGWAWADLPCDRKDMIRGRDPLAELLVDLLDELVEGIWIVDAWLARQLEQHDPWDHRFDLMRLRIALSSLFPAVLQECL